MHVHSTDMDTPVNEGVVAYIYHREGVTSVAGAVTNSTTHPVSKIIAWTAYTECWSKKAGR